jgi:hypothetical protein
VADRLNECCPRRGTRSATFETPSGIISDPFLVEYGHAEVMIKKVNSHVDRLFAGLGDGMSVFMSHFDKLVSLPTVSQVKFVLLDKLLTLTGLCGHCFHQELRVRRHRP